MNQRRLSFIAAKGSGGRGGVDDVVSNKLSLRTETSGTTLTSGKPLLLFGLGTVGSIGVTS